MLKTITRKENYPSDLLTKRVADVDMAEIQRVLREIATAYSRQADILPVLQAHAGEKPAHGQTRYVSRASSPILEGVTKASPHLRTLLSLYDSADEHEIIAALKFYEREQAARRIEYLYGVAEQDPTEDKIGMESLRTLAKVLTNYPSLPHPQISVSPR